MTGAQWQWGNILQSAPHIFKLVMYCVCILYFPKVPPGGLLHRIFTSWKNPLTSVGFEPANLGSRDPEADDVLCYKPILKATFTVWPIMWQITWRVTDSWCVHHGQTALSELKRVWCVDLQPCLAIFWLSSPTTQTPGYGPCCPTLDRIQHRHVLGRSPFLCRTPSCTRCCKKNDTFKTRDGTAMWT